MKTTLKLALPIVAGLGVALVGCSDTAPNVSSEKAAASSAKFSGIRNVSAGEASALIAKNESVALLDVRTPEEFAAGHIEGAINVDFRASDFAEEIGKLDKDTPYLLYCRSGNRSGKALAIMQEQGFTNVAHLHEGYNSWQADNEAR